MTTAPFLAAATPDATHFMQFVLSVGLVLSVVVNVVALFKLGKTQKREVSFSFEPASKKEFDEHVQANRREFDEHVKANERMFEEIGKDASHRRQFIYDKIDKTEGKVMAALGELRRENMTETKAMHERVNQVLKEISEVRGEMKRMPQ
jgi:biopolymer transport protein ExbB/TolQ